MFAQSRIAPERFAKRPSLKCAFSQGRTSIRPFCSAAAASTPGIRQAAQALLSLVLVYDLEDFLNCLKALLQKGEHDLVLIFPAMEERADMTTPVDCGPCQRHLPVALRHLSLPRWNCGKRWGCPSPFGETPYLHGV
jgi:hypothetical protein